MRFEWDPVKERLNRKKHRVAFSEAKQIFDSSLTAYAAAAKEEGEPRFIATGAQNGRILRVVFTEKGGVIRIISARKTTRQEAKIYEFTNCRKG
jgi:uncharacterized DUF497 family protein